MSHSVPYWHVDAFASRAFAGNQAAVMLLEEWLDDSVLQAIAAENMFAETAFLVADASGAGEWELRWFTPELEVRLCGHATLASGHVLLARDPSLERVRLRTRQAGVLEVRRQGAGYEVALPLIPTAPSTWDEAAALLASQLNYGAQRMATTMSSATLRNARSAHWRLISGRSPHSVMCSS